MIEMRILSETKQPSKVIDHRAVLNSIPFFACLREDDLARIGQIIKVRVFRKNEPILLDDETRSFMYVVLSGKVKVVQVSREGKEQILAIHKKRDFFGEMSLLDGKTLPASVVAMEDATVGLIGKADFDRLIMSNDNVLRQMIALLCQRLRDSWLMLRLLSIADAEGRVRAVLTHVSTIYGVKDLRGIVIPMKLTHKEIADFSALARETVSRLLSRLSRSGEIEILDNRNIVLKPSFVQKSPYL
jgi:CRP/FNR family transcriptional regulator, cyclic AMP receptor protein